METTSSTNTAKSTGGRIPRGIRNNNPLNIRKGARWRGLRDFPTDKEFCEFKTMAFGFRAAYKIMLTYYKKHGLRTIREIIYRWAPTIENDTEAYVQYVKQKTGIGGMEDLPDPRGSNDGLIYWGKILLAMASYENGIHYTKMREYEADCLIGIELALR